MYLNLLSDKEKRDFLELAIYAAKANGIMEEAEKITIEAYCKEMELDQYSLDGLNSLDNVLDSLSKSSLENKKIVLMEIIGMCFCDGTIDLSEEAFSRKVAQKLEIDEKLYDTFIKDIGEYTTILRLINSHIF